MIKNSKKAIFFDFGDTLASTDPPYIFRIANGFKRAGYNVSDKDFEHAYLRADCEIFKKHQTHGSMNSDEYNRWFFPILCEFLGINEDPEDVRTNIRNNTTPRRFFRNALPGTQKLLTYLKQKGYILGVISNNDGYTNRKCKDVDIHRYFDIIADSTNIGYVKPDPRIFHHALKELRLEPQDCLHVGDLYGADVLGAKNAGIEVVWLNYRGINIMDDTETVQIKELSELMEIL
ncbi:MAG: HAD family hydrolase [Candidatus Dadabacteria bacterium]|nr:HAD family hydrolase [Candidatus Dadabacteria bacterium]NIS08003.1 HAD family hydrolase [Candidatus Dadabacteria bacterium]NIY21582.1 HAD-IA family hydrolase [Candidatus Dadabacteria bacterium]